jgi:hypothetical protein
MKTETIKELFERLNAESVLPTAIDDGTEIIVSSLSWAAQPVLQGLKKSKFPGSIKVTVTYPDKRVKTATYVFDRWDEEIINESEDKMKSIHRRPCPMRDSIDGQIICSGFAVHPRKVSCEYLDVETGTCQSAYIDRILSGDRVYPTPGGSFNPFAEEESKKPLDPLSELIEPATIKRILDLICEKAQLDIDRSKRRSRRFSIIGDGDQEATAEEIAKQRERRRLWNEREHRENIAAIYRRMAECHELTARLYKEHGLEEEAKEEINNAISASNDSTDVYFKVLEIEKELYVKHEEMFGVDDDVELYD